MDRRAANELGNAQRWGVTTVVGTLSRVRRRAVYAGVAALAAVGLAGCGQDAPVAQTPSQVIDVAVGFVQEGRADRLADLVYADSPEMRAMLNRVGDLLGNLQKLADAIAQEWPEQVSAYRERASAASADSKSLMLTLPAQPGETREQREQRFQTLIAQVFADPYAVISNNAERLGTMRLTDDLASVTFDGMPVYPPVGIQLREVDGLWYLQLPTNIPPISNFWPQSFEEWSIIASMVKVFDRVLVELTEDVRTGRVQRIDQLSEKAWEKVVLPGVLVWGAYAREMDVRQQIDRRMREFDKRERAWSRGVRELHGDEHEPPRSLRSVMRRVAREELAKRVRQRDRFRIDEQMSDETFAAVMTDWLRAAGVGVDLRTKLDADASEQSASAWLEARQAEEDAKRQSAMRRRPRGG